MGQAVPRTQGLRAFPLRTLRSKWRTSRVAHGRRRYLGETQIGWWRRSSTGLLVRKLRLLPITSPLSSHGRRSESIETVNAPKTQVVDWHLAVASTVGTEPLGQRIIEVPENLEQFERRDGRSRWIAYVPPGSVQRGQKLATSGDNKTVTCSICHGPDLRGLGPIPGIAGRSPSYIIRQLYDFRAGVRAGAGRALMKAVVDKLAMGDMISLAAYVASLNP